MSIVLSQCFRMRCGPRYIAMKSELNAKHLRWSLKETRLCFGKHNKEIKNIREYNKNDCSFLQKAFQYAGRSTALKVLPFSKSI